jgi:hypothetical protein
MPCSECENRKGKGVNIDKTKPNVNITRLCKALTTVNTQGQYLPYHIKYMKFFLSEALHSPKTKKYKWIFITIDSRKKISD